MTTTTTQSSAADRVLQALTTKGQTTAELAEATGLGRSTVGKYLTALERDNKATRTRGEQNSGTRERDRWTTATTDRLRPGALNPLVLAYVRDQEQPVGPVAVARALGRSSGAVANCMDRLAKARDLKLVDDKPRRYKAMNHAATAPLRHASRANA